MELKIDVTEEKEQYDREKPEIGNENDLVEMSTKMPTDKVAMFYVVGRELKAKIDQMVELLS